MHQLSVDGAAGGPGVVDYRKGSVISVSQQYSESLPVRDYSSRGGSRSRPPPPPHGKRDFRREVREDFNRAFPCCAEEEEDQEGNGLFGWVLTSISMLIVLLTLPFSLCVCLKVVQEYERAVIFRLGRLTPGGSKGPGIFFVLPCIEKYYKVDLRTITLGVPPQEVLTKDSVTVSVDAVVYYRVCNATLSKTSVENGHHSTSLLSQTILTNILGTKNLHEILSDREAIALGMRKMLDIATEPWGIKVERVEIKDARLPVQLQRAMAAEAEAAREARAKVIQAKGEHKAANNLRTAGETINDSSAALHLRYLQTLNCISTEKNQTVVFPLPIDLVDGLLGTNNRKEAVEVDEDTAEA